MRITETTTTKQFLPVGLLATILLLGACGDKPAPINPPAPAASPASAANDGPAGDTSVKLAVVNFSPKSTPAGTPFNVQRDGNSGISFELTRTPVGEVKLWFDGKPMANGVVVGLIVTSTIPGAYLATAGDYPIELEVAGFRIPAGTFTVTPR